MWLQRMLSLPALVTACVLSAAFVRPAIATPIEFVFAGTVNGHDAYWESWPNPVVHYQPLASPGDLFTGTAYFDPDVIDEFGRHAAGFEVRVNGYSWGGDVSRFWGGWATLTETDLEIVPAFFTAYGGYTGLGGDAALRASLASGTGSFWYQSDIVLNTHETMGGWITSFRAVPDPGSTLLLLGIGLVGLRAYRKRQ